MITPQPQGGNLGTRVIIFSIWSNSEVVEKYMFITPFPGFSYTKSRQMESICGLQQGFPIQLVGRMRLYIGRTVKRRYLAIFYICVAVVLFGVFFTECSWLFATVELYYTRPIFPNKKRHGRRGCTAYGTLNPAALGWGITQQGRQTFFVYLPCRGAVICPREFESV